MFSIDVLGNRLRQHTRLSVDGESEVGCLVGATYPGCYVRLLGQDRATGALLFSSPCDPLGTNPSGSQLFAIRPDGSGLHQITHARGVVIDTPDVIEVELPGPIAYQ